MDTSVHPPLVKLPFLQPFLLASAGEGPCSSRRGRCPGVQRWLPVIFGGGKTSHLEVGCNPRQHDGM